MSSGLMRLGSLGVLPERSSPRFMLEYSIPWLRKATMYLKAGELYPAMTWAETAAEYAIDSLHVLKEKGPKDPIQQAEAFEKITQVITRAGEIQVEAWKKMSPHEKVRTLRTEARSLMQGGKYEDAVLLYKTALLHSLSADTPVKEMVLKDLIIAKAMMSERDPLLALEGLGQFLGIMAGTRSGPRPSHRPDWEESEESKKRKPRRQSMRYSMLKNFILTQPPDVLRSTFFPDDDPSQWIEGLGLDPWGDR